MNEITVHNSVGWFEIYVQDMKRAKAFYETVFGTQFTKLENPGHSDAWRCRRFPCIRMPWALLARW